MTSNAVWAVARNTIAQAIRVRAAFAIMALYLVLVPALPFAVQGDGTLRGQLHVVIGYSLISAGILLGILTLALSTTTLWSEIHEKQIFLLEARPIHRWQILLGKLVGILAINAGLIVFMAVVTWGSVRYLASRPKWSKSERVLAQQQILTARRAVHPEPEKLDDRIARAFDLLKKRASLPQDRTESEIKAQLHTEFLVALNAVRPGVGRVWRLKGLAAARRRDANVTIRFKFAASPDVEEPVLTGWEVGDRRSLDFLRYRAPYKADEVHQVQLPAKTIAEDGTLEIRLYNIEPRRLTLVFSGPDAMQVLIPAASFASNLSRGLWLIFVEVLFLAVLGLFCSTFMSFPVSPVVALSLFLLIFLASSVKTEFDQGLSIADKDSKMGGVFQVVVRGITEAVRFVLPPFDKYAASEPVSSGEEVPWAMILEATAAVAIVRGGILMLLGALIFHRRELAVASR